MGGPSWSHAAACALRAPSTWVYWDGVHVDERGKRRMWAVASAESRGVPAELRAKGRRDVGCRGGWAPQIDTGSCTRPNTCMDPRLVPSERRCASRGVLWLGGGGGRCGDHPVG